MSSSFKSYLNEIARYPLLTVDQEIQYGRRIAAMRELSDIERHSICTEACCQAAGQGRKVKHNPQIRCRHGSPHGVTIMTNPITPPQELILKWHSFAPREHDDEGYVLVPPGHLDHIATQAAQWGADMELEACCEHLRDHQWGFVERPDGTKIHRAIYLHQSRRPRPPSLKAQALEVLNTASFQPASDFKQLDSARETIIRRALNELPDT